MKLSRLEVLSAGEIKQIHEATMDILCRCGVKVFHGPMLDFLRSKGLSVDPQQSLVRFSRPVIEDALSMIPPRFEVFSREGELLYELGDGQTKVAAGHNAVFWLDSQTGQTRYSQVADVEYFARICEQLPVIDMIGIPVMPQDVPNRQLSLLHGVRACVENSRKPIYFSIDNEKVNRGCIEILRSAFRGDLSKQAYGISQLSPTSPLFWETGVIEAIRDTVDLGIPISILPEPNAGVSAPYTLAGLLTMNNAECLSGLVMIQLLKPGSKVIYANSWTTTDMRTGAALVGSIETALCRIAGAQLGRFYRIPSHTTAPNSDNHAHDEQNAWEKTFTALTSIASGNDLIVNCGMFATGMTCSHEQLLMDAEICQMSRRLADGIEVTSDTIAADLIRNIGPQGESYLMADHTLRWLRSPEYFIPSLAVRGPFASWKNQGAKDTAQIARDQVQNQSAWPGCPLDPTRRQKLLEVIHSFENPL